MRYHEKIASNAQLQRLYSGEEDRDAATSSRSSQGALLKWLKVRELVATWGGWRVSKGRGGFKHFRSQTASGPCSLPYAPLQSGPSLPTLERPEKNARIQRFLKDNCFNLSLYPATFLSIALELASDVCDALQDHGVQLPRRYDQQEVVRDLMIKTRMHELLSKCASLGAAPCPARQSPSLLAAKLHYSAAYCRCPLFE